MMLLGGGFRAAQLFSSSGQLRTAVSMASHRRFDAFDPLHQPTTQMKTSVEIINHSVGLTNFSTNGLFAIPFLMIHLGKSFIVSFITGWCITVLFFVFLPSHSRRAL